MTVSTALTKYHHPCSCRRSNVTVIRRDPAARSGNGAPILVWTETHGNHDPRREHSLRVPVRAWDGDRWPSRA